ncbi:serine protease, S1-C subfamily, contains C-terminal PDZ domain [Gordonia malaquae]|uniref:Peptidase S1 family protein n=1 Tax=Gordonia malaquae NBRC 108250 TaxID=1223542 RepID=M3UZM8_GORML|nr:trypsin-like peptidase domain-containing protein [Gordonia malaquae]GAC81472.1 peptidase S1 family protein [Gordonia malaquae NBRC 108250]SEC26700.1 serine protease, S1-C subfamily, contains C-terminal PDZ domain [Gordonia malaquae]
MTDLTPQSRDEAVFGRPSGVTGSFDKSPATERPQPTIAAPDPVLGEAFGRPDGETQTLQRDPHAVPIDETPDEPADPWRDPSAGASLDAPALQPVAAAEPSTPGPKLGIRDLLSGERVHGWALATLAMVALLIGLGGGLIGRWTAEVVTPLNSDSVKLNVDDSSNDNSEGATRVSRVAGAMAKAVVTIEVRTATSGETGSGFVLDKSGYIATNNHVITSAATDRSAKLEVVFSDRTRIPARLVGRDPKTDLAVIKVDNVQNLTVSTLGDSSKLEIGEDVVAFGAPLGLAKTVTSGIVSAVDRPVPLRPDATSDTDAVINAIQTDASINPGNSGGPLVDSKARVIGVNTAALAPSGTSIGLGFAIPINEAKPVIESLIKNGKMNHPTIGVSAATVRNDRVFGAAVRDVAQGSPAARAGLREGDVITNFNGRAIEGADELTVAVRTSKIDDAVKFTYWRDGRTFNGSITPVSD